MAVARKATRCNTKQRKYHNVKVEVDGRIFDSRREADRYQELSWLLKTGEITDLRCQVPFVLIPAQRFDGKVVERACKYIADFAYYRGRTLHVEDVKGMRTPEYKIKRKLMLYIHGIRIEEVC